MRVNTTDLQNAFGKYLFLVQKEDIVIDKNGKSVESSIFKGLKLPLRDIFSS